MAKNKRRNVVRRKPAKKEQIGEVRTNYLFSIGIDKYTFCRPLSNAVKDIRDVTNVLFGKYQFDDTHYFSLENEMATKDNIIATFRKIIQKLTPRDNLVIYYSGHGELDSDFNESYWIPVNARKGKIGDYISLESLVKIIKAIKTHHTVLIIDACFAGAVLVNRRSVSYALEKDPSRYVIASGRQEFASDGEPGKNSPFATAILEKLLNNTESLLVTDLGQYVKKQTIKATKNNQRPIHNPLQISEDKGGEFVFHLKSKLHQFSLNTFIDERDGQKYKTVRLKDGKIWMAQNFNFNTGKNCWNYQNNPANGPTYGRLYSWEAAQKACPKGWHIPTDEEWWRMIQGYGKSYNRLSGQEYNTGEHAGEAAFKALTIKGSSGFSVVLGGSRHNDGSFRHLNDWGYFWTNTEKNIEQAWYYYFDLPRKRLSRYRNEKGLGFSLRCIKN